MGRLPRSAPPSTGKRGSLHRLLVTAAAIVLLAAAPFAESVRTSAISKVGRGGDTVYVEVGGESERGVRRLASCILDQHRLYRP